MRANRCLIVRVAVQQDELVTALVGGANRSDSVACTRGSDGCAKKLGSLPQRAKHGVYLGCGQGSDALGELVALRAGMDHVESVQL